MTVPIARVVATRYAHAEPPLRFCYFAHAYRGVRPHRGQMREFLQAGIELVGAPGPHGTVEALTVLCEALDAVGLVGYRIGAGRRRALPGAAGDLRRRGRASRERPARRARGPGLRRPGARGRASRGAGRRRCCASRSCAAVPRCSTRSPAARPTACARSSSTCPSHVARAHRLRPRPRARPGLLHRRGLRRARSRARRAAGRRRALRRPARALRAAACRPWASRCGVDRLHLALAGEEAA